MRLLANQKLAVRLGVAFGALALGLAIVAAIGFNQMGSLRNTTEELGSRSMRASALAGDLAKHAAAVGNRVADHLYVYDGTLQNQDRVAAEIQAVSEQNDATEERLRSVVRGMAAEPELERFAALSDRYYALVAETVDVSRRETVEGSEEREGSRGPYVGTLVPDARRAGRRRREARRRGRP